MNGGSAGSNWWSMFLRQVIVTPETPGIKEISF
jgi:hypothetical protein